MGFWRARRLWWKSAPLRMNCDRVWKRNRYYLMILNLPVKGFDPREILYTLRHQKRASSDSILILLAPDDILPEYRSTSIRASAPCSPIPRPAPRLKTPSRA